MTTVEKIEYFEERARQERDIAAAAVCEKARAAHLGLALEHERAAEQERSKPIAVNAA